MLVSINELKKYVDISDLSVEEIAHKFTFSGFEVEEIVRVASGTNLVIGEILECENHPDSDHLHVLKVDLGPKYGVEQIVCGAPNARKGLKVIVSRVGAKLPGGEIKKSVIRGVESNGMCCSLNELGVDPKFLKEEQTKGIEELPMDAEVGSENVLEYLGLDDVSLNLSILANRPDLLSIYNVAKEAGALFERKVNIPENKINENFVTDLKVGSETSLCKQFSSREVRGIITKPSPAFMSNALRSMGIRSINNIVDIGNYVMLLTGQPLHMYDADKLERTELIAKDNYEGPFIALDEKEYALKNKDIVITSNNKAMCLGGVMGANECAVDENTKRIYIESASFDGAAIRRTSNRLGLASESSMRFVKGTNHFQYEEVLNLATDLLIRYAEAKEVSNIVTYLNETKENKIISSSKDRINNRLGTSFSQEEILDVLSRLNFNPTKIDENEFAVVVPTFRLDVTCDADLSEEVIRVLGFDHVRSVLPTFDSKVGMLNLYQNRKRKIREFLLNNGLDECLTYSLVKSKETKEFNLLNDELPYVILNPLTDEHEALRTHILASLMKVASYNVNRQNKDLALFEESLLTTKSSSEDHLAVVLVGRNSLQGLLKEMDYDFYSLKGIVEGIFALLNIDKSRYQFKPYSGPSGLLHPGKSADIVFQNQVIGRLGEIYPTLYDYYDLGKTHAIALEMKLGLLLNAKVNQKPLEVISKFPSVDRDIALIVDQRVTVSELIKTIKVNAKGLVKEANVFDVYSGTGIMDGFKSIAIKITFSSDHTLVDKEINEAMDKIKFELAKTYGAELRM